jgi:hypothetical protein
MTDKMIDLDGRRGMEAQKATDLRRLLAEVEANERTLRLRQDELEAHLADAPAASWEEAAEKVRYVLGLYAGAHTSAPQWPIISGRSVRTDDDVAARGVVSRRRSSQMVARRHNAGSKCEANSRLISKGCQ